MNNEIMAQNPIVELIAAESSPFTPEYSEFIKQHPGRGTLKIQLSAANEAFPVSGASVDVSLVYNGERYSLYQDVSDSSGIVDNIVLPAQLSALTLSPETCDTDAAHYLVSVFHPAFKQISDCGITIYDKIETILPINLTPVPSDSEDD